MMWKWLWKMRDSNHTKIFHVGHEFDRYVYIRRTGIVQKVSGYGFPLTIEYSKIKRIEMMVDLLFDDLSLYVWFCNGGPWFTILEPMNLSAPDLDDLWNQWPALKDMAIKIVNNGVYGRIYCTYSFNSYMPDFTYVEFEESLANCIKSGSYESSNE